MFLRTALEAQRRRAAGTNCSEGDWRVISAAECEAPGCAEPIPDARRQALPGVQLCIDCAARLERLKK